MSGVLRSRTMSNGGEWRIRTLGPLQDNGFQDRRVRPLCQLSIIKFFVKVFPVALPACRQAGTITANSPFVYCCPSLMFGVFDACLLKMQVAKGHERSSAKQNVVEWRRGRDSNPRSSFPDNTLAGCPFQPLRHLSIFITNTHYHACFGIC